jgi:allophanate hydrolase subunit 2
MAGPWTITNTSRVGVRLRGGSIERATSDELPSEGLVRGAIQVPPGGEPVMMLADHPTTGGYPVIAVVHPDDVAIVAQHSAGASIRFRNYG